ncbi:MAG: beta-N-acetylhexosaminidase [Clostridia bacterium]|nr:beta-N-acetylhexosaminidase [Clostridia bacterium]
MIKLSIIPEPVSFKIKGDCPAFILTDGVLFEGDETTENALSDLVAFLDRVFGFISTGTGKEKIRLEISDCEPREGYSLKIEKDRILLKGNGESGLFYAVQTLKQLIFQSEGSLPEAEITDYPRFASRGFMLDCARHFFTVDAVKQFLDMTALHKLNEFHWHLSDDQGFRCRLESKLLLTEIGSYRSHTCWNSIPHQGYYTKSDLSEIVSYAHKKHIRVIPEINSPGHVMSMLAAYPHLACKEKEYTVSSFFGVKEDVLCIGKESTFTFVEEVFGELAEIFTDNVIHLGGDEVPTVRFKDCPDCQRRMKEEGLTDESELCTYYLERIALHLMKKGIEVRVRDTKLENMDICRQVTSGSASYIAKELESGSRLILSPESSCFLNLPCAVTDLEKCYGFEPLPEGVTQKGEKNLIGIEACLWTELTDDMLKADKATYPRLGAICETAWSDPAKRDFSRFCDKLGSYRALLLSEGVFPDSLKNSRPRGIKKAYGKLSFKKQRLLRFSRRGKS